MKMHSLLAFVLAVPAAFATSFYIRPFSEFTRGTPNIIRGKISNIHTENGVTADGGKTIYTFADLEIKEVIKGHISGTRIIVRKLGGTKDDVTLEIPSSVEFADHEEGVFFLSQEQEDHSYEVSSLELGKFQIERQGSEEVLQGGLFAYSKPHGHDHSHDVMANDLSENQRTWSVHQLKELVQAQESIHSEHSQNEKNTPSSAVSDEKSVPSHPLPSEDSPSASSSPPETTSSSPWYLESTFWYSFSAIILAVGLVWLFRKR